MEGIKIGCIYIKSNVIKRKIKNEKNIFWILIDVLITAKP